MPKATPAIRQSNAAAKALATVAKLHSEGNHGPRLSVVAPSGNLSEESEESSNEIEASEDLGDLPGSESDEVPEENIVPASAEKNRLHWDQSGGEDFFDYINSINPESQRTITVKISAVNQDGSTGGLLKNITGGWDKIDEAWIREQLGAGKFKVELKTPPKSGRRNDWTRVQVGSDEEIKAEGLKKQGAKAEGGAGSDGKSVDLLYSASEKGLDMMEKMYNKSLEKAQTSSDPVGMLKAVAEFMPKADTKAATDPIVLIKTILELVPKPDNSALISMLAAQKDDAERRAAADKAEAAIQRERDKEFFLMMKQQSDGMNAVLLKQAESKSDTMTQMTSLITSFMTVREKIEDSLGGGGPKGWEGVVGQLIDRAPDAIAGISAVMAARNGATPAQVQALQHQNQPQPQPQIENDFQEMIHRLGKYMSRDTGLWLTEAGVAYIAGDPGDDDSDPIPGMIQVEYPAIFEGLFVGQPKDAIIASINGTQIGAAIMANPQGSEFMNKVIDSIKLQMVPGADKPEEVPAEPVRKNGKAKAHA